MTPTGLEESGEADASSPIEHATNTDPAENPIDRCIIDRMDTTAPTTNHDEPQRVGRDAMSAKPHDAGRSGDESDGSPATPEHAGALTLARVLSVLINAGDIERARPIVADLVRALEGHPSDAEIEISEREFREALDRPRGVVVSLASARARKAAR